MLIQYLHVDAIPSQIQDHLEEVEFYPEKRKITMFTFAQFENFILKFNMELSEDEPHTSPFSTCGSKVLRKSFS